jgi:hypothetical protein
MADAEGSRLNLGSPVAPRGRGRPRGSKNKTTLAAADSSLAAPVKRRPGRPPGSKNKAKVTVAQVPALLRLLLLLPLQKKILSSALPWRSAVRFSACR